MSPSFFNPPGSSSDGSEHGSTHELLGTNQQALQTVRNALDSAAHKAPLTPARNGESQKPLTAPSAAAA